MQSNSRPKKRIPVVMLGRMKGALSGLGCLHLDFSLSTPPPPPPQRVTTGQWGQTAPGCGAPRRQGWDIKAGSAVPVHWLYEPAPSRQERLAVQTAFVPHSQPAFLIGHGLAPAAFLG